jgi:hypothetical protein
VEPHQGTIRVELLGLAGEARLLAAFRDACLRQGAILERNYI